MVGGGGGVLARDVAIDLMTAPKLSKKRLNECPKPQGWRVCAKVFLGSKNGPSHVVGGCARGT